MSSVRCLCLLVCACTFVAPAGAGAAVVGTATVSSGSLIYSAGPGEANEVSVTREGDRVVIEDRHATIDPEDGCTGVNPNRVWCQKTSSLWLDLGGGDDRAELADDLAGVAGHTVVDGGPGSDQLAGSASPNSLGGGSGHDVLRGGSGTGGIDAVTTFGGGSLEEMPDVLSEADLVTCVAVTPGLGIFGGGTVVSDDQRDQVRGPCGQVLTYTKDAVVSRGTEGDDWLTSSYFPSRLYGLGGNDRIFGGTCSRCRSDGGPGDDTLEGGGLMLGGDGNDHFSSAIANALPVRQDGGPGNDVMIGRYGNDRIVGGPGRDRMSGGLGDDYLNARDGERDTVHCGDGADRVIADRKDAVSGDCERVSRR